MPLVTSIITPLGFYSQKLSPIAQLAGGAQVAIPERLIQRRSRSVDDGARLLVPKLQRRGRCKTEDAPETLREELSGAGSRLPFPIRLPLGSRGFSG